MAHDDLFARHQFPPSIIRHAVWLYVRFILSYHDVEDLLAERGLDVSYETVPRWTLKFGPLFARELRRRRPANGVVASRRDGRDDCGPAVLVLARGRRSRRGPRSPDATMARQGCTTETDAQAAQETSLRARCAGGRQTAFLRRSQVGDGILGSPQAGLAEEQSGREFASADATARAQNAALQIARISPSASSIHAAVHNTFNVHAISRPATRSASSEAKRSGLGEPRRQHELEV